MKLNKKSLMLTILILLLLAINIAVLSAASPPEPTYKNAVVDGNSSEWNTTDPNPDGDFFANMYRAFNPSKPIESELFLRYDCITNTAYALVQTVNNPLRADLPAAAWIAIDGVNNKVVLGTSGNDGTPPDFAWVGLNTAGDRATAYEASFPLAEGSYKLVAHVDVEDNGAQTSGTIKLNDGIDLVISCPRDKGDLPDDIGGSPDYPTLNASSGPSHIIGDLYLGNCVDAETNGQPNVAAVGDDANLGGASVQKGYIAPSSCSLGADDEDGVQPVLPWSNGANGGKVSVTTSGSGYFCGWLDFGAAGGGMPDGTFDSVISTAVTGTGPHVISFTVPDGTFAGSGSNVMVYMRFRLFTEEPAGGCTTNSGYTGEAKNGEVEDYKFAFSPTAVSLQAVAASVNDSWQMPIVFTALALFGITILLYLRRRPV